MCKRPINPILPTAESDTISFLQKVEFIDWQLAQLKSKVDSMTVEGNVDTSSDDPVLESLQIGDDKFRVVGTDVEGNVTISGGEESLTSIQIGETVYKIDGTSDTDSGTGTILEPATSKTSGLGWSRCGKLFTITVDSFETLNTESVIPIARIDNVPIPAGTYIIPFTSAYIDGNNHRNVVIGMLRLDYLAENTFSVFLGAYLYMVDGVSTELSTASFALLQGLDGCALSFMLN